MKKVVKCGTFFDAANGTTKKDIAVVIEENKIVKVAPVKDVDTKDCEVIDLSGKFVMPGLIDGHMHIGMNGEPTVHGLYTTLPTYLPFLAEQYAKRDLMAGFTTIRCEGDVDFVDIALRTAIENGICIGPRMQCSGVPISTTGGHGDHHYIPAMKGGQMATICKGPDEVRDATRYTFKYGADQVKLMATGGVMSDGDEPGAAEMTYDEMRAACEIAEMHGKTSTAHAHGAKGIKNAIRAGITSIEHGMLIDDEGIDMLVEHGTYLVPTIIAAYRIVEHGVEAGIPADNVRKAKLCLENHNDHLKVMVKKGVKIAFGTDTGTPYSKHGEQAFEFQLMEQAGIPAVQILQSATKVCSEMIKKDNIIGTIEEGKLADIVAFDENPLEKGMKVMANCAFVMKDGVVYKG